LDNLRQKAFSVRRYASGATIQVLLFAILAIQVKRRCPVMHTYLEVIQVRGKQLYRVYFDTENDRFTKTGSGQA